MNTVIANGSKPQVPEEKKLSSSKLGRVVIHGLERYGLLVLAALLTVFFSVLPITAEVFPTVANLRVGLLSQSVLIIVAMASLLPIISGHYDFSVGATAGYSAIVTASVASSGASVFVSIATGLLTGLTIGAVNGFLITVVKLDSVIVTLGTTILIAGLVNWKTDGQSIVNGIPDALLALSAPVAMGIPGSFVAAMVLTLVVYYVLRHTPFGRYVHAMGINRSAARLVGLRPNRLTFATFLLSALIAALAGVVQLGIQGAANPNVGPSLTLPAIAAVFLGAAAISPGRFNVWGTVVAIVFLGILNSGLNMTSTAPFINDLANGLALIIGVSLAALLGVKRR